MNEQEQMTISMDNGLTTVTFLPASGASGQLVLSLEQLTKFIQKLGEVRGVMVEGIEPPEIGKVKGVFNTRWYTRFEGLTEGSLLAFQHPEFGPVGFVFPRDQVAYLVSLLSQQLEIQPSSTGLKN